MDERLFYCGISLFSASAWALGAILWQRLGEQLSSPSLNLGRSIIGTLCLGSLVLVIGVAPVTPRDIALLGASGILGIAIGDTFFFRSLRHLGARRASLLGALNPVVIAVAASLFLGERPSPAVGAGILVTSLGVGWVLWERASRGEGGSAVGPGLRYGLLSVLCTSGAVLLAKIGLVSVPALHAAAIRLLAGALALALWGAWRSELGSWLDPFRNGRLLARVALVTLIVIIGGFCLSLLALKHIEASVAGTLNATAPLFILPMAIVLLKEKISWRGVLGTVLAVAGIGLILGG